MKTALLLLVAAGVSFGVASFVIAKRDAAHAEALAAWNKEKAALEAELEAARTRPPTPAVMIPAAAAPAPAPAKLTPADIMAKLQALKGGGPRNLREAAYWLTELAHAGPAAFPVIREFLARNEDLDLDVAQFAQSKGGREVPLDFALPPSLRFGLFDVLRQIGSPEAEQILAESLTRTGRGVEVAYLSRALQEIAPNKYKEQALSVARDLLASATPVNSASPLDRGHRDNLFSVLAMYNDASFAATAQTQVVQPDGQIDRGALKYLQQALGPQAVSIAAQLYQDPRVSDSAKKEPLARLALNFVGADQLANDFYNRAINDPVLAPNHRKNLIEDLNQDGLNFKNLTPQDLPLIQSRLALIDQLGPNAMDNVNAAALQEAKKDLLNMANRLAKPPQ